MQAHMQWNAGEVSPWHIHSPSITPRQQREQVAFSPGHRAQVLQSIITNTEIIATFISFFLIETNAVYSLSVERVKGLGFYQ